MPRSRGPPRAWCGEAGSSRDAIEPFCDFRRQNYLSGTVAAILPLHKFSWPPIGRAAMPHSQNLNGRIHAHSFPRFLSFFGSVATPCSVAGVAASPFFCTCRLCLHMPLCLLSVSWNGAWESSDAINGHARGERERPRACPATECNPKP